VIEVYKGNQKAEKHFGIYSLYVMFYPQLVTGPIERPQQLLVQLREVKKFEYNNLAQGLRLMLFGLFIKMVIADNVAVYVDQIYKNPESYNSFSILKGIFLYAFQIYCDFLGYSTIAVGCARTMGYTLMDNFKTPYLSRSIGEFWQRWHISLSFWFRDYVYFSLGGNKVKIQRWMVNIFIVFILSGLWHGANWTFILWGFAHGLAYISEHFITRIFNKKSIANQGITWLSTAFQMLRTFIIVSFLWVPFRATSIEQVKAIFKSIVKNIHIADNFSVEPKVWCFLGVFILMDFLLFNTRFDLWCQPRKPLIRWAIYSLLIFMIVVFASVENFPFIYFQF
jgi:D-alanyl-lipoteichoic acid acyltransferase DltB (MBOAT superfamily)